LEAVMETGDVLLSRSEDPAEDSPRDIATESRGAGGGDDNGPDTESKVKSTEACREGPLLA